MNIKWITWFCFLGPLGNLIPVLPNLAGFKFYFVVIGIGNLYNFIRWKENIRAITILTKIFPLIGYMFISSMIGYLTFGTIDFQGVGEGVFSYNPIFRVTLTFLLFSYVLFIGTGYYDLRKKYYFLMCFLAGYFVSLVAGYLILILFTFQIIDIEIIKKIEVLPQFAWGFLRFAPGSNANEYGIVTSYALTLSTLFIYYRKMKFINGYYKRIKGIYIIYFFMIGALFMTTTRAAYISYIISIIYIILRRGNLMFKFKKICIFLLMSVVTMWMLSSSLEYLLDIDVLGILEGGYQAIGESNSTVGDRFQAWEDGYNEYLTTSVWFGIGAGRAYMLHNIYLQFYFELGAIGFSIFAIYVMLGIYKLYNWIKMCNNPLLIDVAILGIVHVLWFGASNHGLNQFLTWYVFFTLFLLKPCKTDN